MRNKKIVLLIVLLLVCVLSLTACGETSLADLQEEAIEALDTELAKYASTDYTTDNYAIITAAYDTAVAGINAVTDKANLPGSFVATFTTAADAVLTIAEQNTADTATALATAKTSAIASLDTALATYTESDYTTDNYATITAAYDTAVAGINAVTDVADLPGSFVATFTTAADAVLTIAEQEVADAAAALAAAKADAIDDLDEALAVYTESYYTEVNYAIITTAYSTAKASINGVELIENLPGDFVSAFTTAADEVVTIAETLAAAKASAIEALATALATYTEVDYTVTNYATITSAYATAKAGINAVTDVANLPGDFVAAFTDYADRVVTIAEQAAADAAALASKITAELAVLDTALANYDSADYITDNYATITTAYTTAKASIEAVTDIANLPGAFVSTFTTSAEAVVTIAQQAAADLAAEKLEVIADLDTALAAYSEGNYATNYALITSAYATAVAGINAVTDVADLPGSFVATFVSTADEVVTIAEQAAAALAAAKTSAIEALDTALAAYTEGDYTVTNYATITTAYTTAKTGIEAVTDIADLPGDFVADFTTAADAVDDIYVGFSFSENTDGTYTVSSYTGTATEVIVPSTYNGSAVTAIAAGAEASSGVFYAKTKIVSLTLPDSITTIGSYAFYYCTNLTSVYYAGTLDEWATMTFSTNNMATPMNYASHFYCDGDYDNEVTSIELSGNISYVNAFAFYGFVNVTSVTIGEGVESIYSYAFYNCPSLYEITIPNSVTLIGNFMVSIYRLDEEGRTGTTFVVSCAETLLLMLNNTAFYSYMLVTNGPVYYPENTLQLGADIYFESGMETAATSRWFYGTIDGTDAMYSFNNIEALSESVFIGQAGNSAFKNLVINVGQTGGIFVRYAAGDYAKFENIETYGDVYVTSGTANYSPILAVGSWYTVTVYFTNVTTYTNLTILGSGYFSNFLGGYCLGNVVFENCINYGDMIGEYPSVFVGNYNEMSAEQITIKESVYNLGTIIGYGSAGYFGANGNGDSDCAEYVSLIEVTSGNIKPTTISDSIIVTNEEGMISLSDSTDGATQYLVSYSAYATLTGETDGTRFITISFLVSADDMTDTGLPATVIMTSTLHEGVDFVASNTNTDIAAMLYQVEGVWYLYVDTSVLTGDSANCLLDNKSTSVLVIGLDDNLDFVFVL